MANCRTCISKAVRFALILYVGGIIALTVLTVIHKALA